MSHAIGVEPVHSIDDLKRIVKQHFDDTSERYCPVSIEMHGGLRLSRWVARGLKDDGFLVRRELHDEPEVIPDTTLLSTPFFGRYITEGRMFYDSLGLESVVPMLQTMQRLS
jgi:hypothetical protein